MICCKQNNNGILRWLLYSFKHSILRLRIHSFCLVNYIDFIFALVDGSTVIGSCAVAGSERMLSRMVGIYENVVEGARNR